METHINNLIFFVNGKKVTVDNPDPEMTLLYFLRSKLRLTGSKVGCGEGGCGACTVMLSTFDGCRIKHYSVNSCLTPVCSVHGQAVTTVEGIGSVRSNMHPVQKAIAESHGSQCGFCTPGIVMSAYALLRNQPYPTKSQLRESLDGNLCRCTGYRPILEGLYQFTKQEVKGCGRGENCCQLKQTNPHTNGNDTVETAEDNCASTELIYDPTQEIIFPPELKLLSTELHSQSLHFRSDRVTWYRPTSLQELLDLKSKFLEGKLVAGNTEIAIDTRFRHEFYPVMISTQMVKELHQITITDEGILIGSSVTLSVIREQLKDLIEEQPEHRTRLFSAFNEMLKWFAGAQIRNVASLGGNIINASPVSDLNPLLLAIKACLCIASIDGHRKYVMDMDFFTDHRKTCMKSNEVLVSVMLPFTTRLEYVYSFKQAVRKEDDTTIANAGMYVSLTETDHKVLDIRLAFGGMAKTTVMAEKTMEALKGRSWDPSLLEVACSEDMLPSDLQLSLGAPGGMIAYRRTLCLSFFFRFYNSVEVHLTQDHILEDDICKSLEPGESQGSQFYAVSKSNSVRDTIGKPLVHKSAHMQCTGEATYLDDIPITEGELFLGLVMSSKSHARIVSVDPDPALSMPGVVAFLDHRDVPGANEWDATECVFAVEKVVHEGQIIAAVVATSPVIARRAARTVKVTLEELKPIVTIEDAIKSNVVHSKYTVQRGDPISAFPSCPHTVEGEMHVNAQEHFYLEPHGCVVYPVDANEIDVITTTQSPTHMQKCLSRVLGLPANRIKVHVKRLGGGFGGKETRNASLLLPTAIAARKIGCPVRCVLDRDEDMRLTGTRHPAYIKYKIGFYPDGKITALDADLYLNMGSSFDLSPAVLETALLTSDNAYKIDNFCMRGHLCQTNLTSCTAFRAFGGPQSIVMAETWISHVADFLQAPYEQIRERNFYHSGDFIPCGQMIKNCNIQRCWDECIKQSDFHHRQKNVEEFNRSHTWKKRGISVTPLKYGLAFLQKSMNQGSALVNIYTDGSVLVFHGGVEMGQGLHTKMIQVASRELDISEASIHIMETCSSATPNTGPTAASMSSDLYGAALIDACKTLASRLAPYRKAKPHATMKQWAESAQRDCVSLSACGFYHLDDVSLDWSKKENNPFSYFSFGAACSEVEIDCLTGDHQVLTTDIVMDVGHSLNPAIDVGQIEGAFIQGYGMYLLEEYRVSPKGIHNSTGPSTYKIPSFGNIPHVFNVSLLKDSKNPRALYSSKGVGEPPLCLATSVFMAVKMAVKVARLQNGIDGHFRLDSPATSDKIRMACGDHLAFKFLDDLKKEDTNPWSVRL